MYYNPITETLGYNPLVDFPTSSVLCPRASATDGGPQWHRQRRPVSGRGLRGRVATQIATCQPHTAT